VESAEVGKAAVEVPPAVISAKPAEMPGPNRHSKRETSIMIAVAATVIVAASAFLTWNVHWNRSMVSQDSDSKQQVQDAVSIWANAFRSKNAIALSDSYAGTVEKYFRRDNVSREQIQGYFQSAFSRIEYINAYQIDNIQVEMLPAVKEPDKKVISGRAAATFRKIWDTRQFDGKASSGEEIEKLTFASSPEGWKIVREEEVNVIRSSRH
jgi:hypothetical protein